MAAIFVVYRAIFLHYTLYLHILEFKQYMIIQNNFIKYLQWVYQIGLIYSKVTGYNAKRNSKFSLLNLEIFLWLPTSQTSIQPIGWRQMSLTFTTIQKR